MSQVRLSREAGRALPAGFKLADFANRNAFRLGPAAGTVTARLRVLPEEAWRLKERLPATIVSEDKAGVVEAAIEVAAPERFFKFVLGFGEYAQILDPPELRQAFLKHLEAGS
jgi:predicted DNA-binding transcriptional regulator YafY